MHSIAKYIGMRKKAFKGLMVIYFQSIVFIDALSIMALEFKQSQIDILKLVL